ncbi:heavy metal-associated isoprenylated plant protein 47 isoform X1 [Zea mays]|uniref:ATFP4 n=2 Tax=Zea mays TaxID=4577 RepID=A0A804MEV7_MAIZE|nr:heavy metal-associated isoprenylated plant protein 47 isoform X1 [Zea mays]|eukprot:XP_008669289.1 heavy metal-associated isoprenylated plant protein 47 isoform X1 [Zea mays]
MSKQKIVIKLGVPNAKNRSKAMQLASKFVGVSKVGITGDGKDRLEVEGEGVDTVLLVNYLRKKVCRSADIVKVEVKDKKDEKKPEEPPYYCWPNYYYCPPPPPPLPMVERADDSCHVM